MEIHDNLNSTSTNNEIEINKIPFLRVTIITEKDNRFSIDLTYYTNVIFSLKNHQRDNINMSLETIS